MPRNDSVGPEVVALGGVVVDDVEDDLDAGLVHRAHHRLELVDLPAERAGRRVGRVRREEADRVVAPVVGEPLLLQQGIVRELLHGHELDRGRADALQVLDDRPVREAAVGAALVLRDLRVQLGESLHVRLVDHRAVVRDARRDIARPVEALIDHDAEHHARGGVLVVAGVRDRRRCSRTATGSSRSRRRSPSRTGRAAACWGSRGGRSPGRTVRSRGSRSAARDRRPAGSRARRTRRPPAA